MINMTLPDETENYIHRIGRVGRAEHLGLAISIVAPLNCCERVWYHKCSNRGAGCSNRNLIDEGGCTTWYDETELLRKIEQRIHTSIPELDPENFSLPAVLGSNLSDYGEEIKAEKYIPNYHLEMLAPKVKQLAKMEVEAQNIFLIMENKFRFH